MIVRLPAGELYLEFTQISAAQPERPYGFAVQVLEDEKYKGEAGSPCGLCPWGHYCSWAPGTAVCPLCISQDRPTALLSTSFTSDRPTCKLTHYAVPFIPPPTLSWCYLPVDLGCLQ